MTQPDLDEKTRAELSAEGIKAVDSATFSACQNCMLASFLLSFATLGASAYYHLVGRDDFYLLAPILILVGFVPAILAGLFKGSFKRTLACLFHSLLPTSLFAAFAFCLFGMTLASVYSDQKKAESFVQLDFVKYDTATPGQVHSDVLQQAMDQQNQLSSDKARLETIKSDIGNISSLGQAQKDSLLQNIQSSEDLVAKQLIPNEQYSRLFATRNIIYRAGTPVSSAPSPKSSSANANQVQDLEVYSATAAQIKGYRQVIEGQHPYWLKFISWLGLI